MRSNPYSPLQLHCNVTKLEPANENEIQIQSETDEDLIKKRVLSIYQGESAHHHIIPQGLMLQGARQGDVE